MSNGKNFGKNVGEKATVKKEFKNEVEMPNLNFFNFDEQKVFTGLIFGERKEITTQDKKYNCFIAQDEEGTNWLLPSNVQLMQKLENLCKIKESELSVGIDVQIINEGLQKVEGVANKVKIFKVLTT